MKKQNHKGEKPLSEKINSHGRGINCMWVEDVKQAVKRAEDRLKKELEKWRKVYEDILEERKYKDGSIKSVRLRIIIEDYNKIINYLAKIFKEEFGFQEEE